MIRIPQCYDCSRLRKTPKGKRGIFCDAFPAGVPAEIMFNRHRHTEPYPGDNGLLFQPKEDGEGEK